MLRMPEPGITYHNLAVHTREAHSFSKMRPTIIEARGLWWRSSHHFRHPGRITMAAQDERSVQSHSTHTPGALTGLRVIELADEQAEYCGLALAGLGAEVIKWSHPAAAPRAASVPSTKTGKIPSAPCSSGSTTAASARLCLICTSRKTATSSAHSLPRPTCCWSPRPRESWMAWG